MIYTKKRIIDFIDRHNTMSLATVSEDGSPHCASLFYVNRGLVIFFISKLSSLHTRNISCSPGVSITINKDYNDWRIIKGLQIKGNVSEVHSSEYKDLHRLYVSKFPFVHKIVDSRISSMDTRFYKITPGHIKFINNEISFGFKEELNLNISVK